MGIFKPGKDGDAMGGGYAFQRMGKKQRAEFAQEKSLEEERDIAGSHYASKRLSQKFNDTIKRQKEEAMRMLAVRGR